jgi:hypothetical protein
LQKLQEKNGRGNMKKGDIYTNDCNGQQVTCTVLAIESDSVTIRSDYRDRNWTMPIVHFEAVMGMLGFSLQREVYRIFFTDENGFADPELEFCNQAIELGRQAKRPFRVELGSMTCCRWTPIDGLMFTSEYKAWHGEQQRELARMEGSYGFSQD